MNKQISKEGIAAIAYSLQALRMSATDSNTTLGTELSQHCAPQLPSLTAEINSNAVQLPGTYSGGAPPPVGPTNSPCPRNTII